MRNLLVVLVLLAACTEKPTSGKLTPEQLQAIIAQAQKDSAAEASFIKDSLALDSTFVTSTVAGTAIKIMPYDYVDDDDNRQVGADTLYYATALDSTGHSTKYCRVEKPQYQSIPSTLRCQWSDKMETDDQ